MARQINPIRSILRNPSTRRPGAAAIAVLVTFGLFYLMHALSAVRDVAIPIGDRFGPIEIGFVAEDSVPRSTRSAPRVFDRAATRAALRCRFQARKVDGEAVPTRNVGLVFSFDPTALEAQEETR